MKILYLENHPHFSKLVIKEFLAGYKVTLATKLSEAKVLVGDQQFDLALVDYDLDDGKGSEFIKYINDIAIKLPVIACSSHEKGNNALIESGAVAVCSKLEFRNIAKVIESVIHGYDQKCL